MDQRLSSVHLGLVCAFHILSAKFGNYMGEDVKLHWPKRFGVWASWAPLAYQPQCICSCLRDVCTLSCTALDCNVKLRYTTVKWFVNFDAADMSQCYIVSEF